MKVKITPKRLRFLQKLSKNKKCSIISIGRNVFYTNVAVYKTRDIFLENGLIVMKEYKKNITYAEVTEIGTKFLMENI